VDLAYTLRQLWNLRVYVALAAVVALLGAALTAYDLRVMPPSLKSKELEVGSASTQLMVDSSRSPLVTLDDDFEPLAERAGIYARFMASPPVRNAIAEAVGLPPYAISAESPDAGNPAEAEANGEAPTNITAPDLVEGVPYRLVFFPRGNIVTIFAQATTPAEAERLADGAVVGFQKYVARLQETQRIPARARVQLRQLGEARGGLINEGVSRNLAILTFFGLFGAGCVLILVLANVARGWRAARAAELGVPEAVPYPGADGRPRLDGIPLYDANLRRPDAAERAPESATF
jgi:hypothetical protein